MVQDRFERFVTFVVQVFVALAAQKHQLDVAANLLPGCLQPFFAITLAPVAGDLDGLGLALGALQKVTGENPGPRAQDWRDKLRVWMARTGWQPEDVAAKWPRRKNDLSTFEKYNPEVPSLASWYGFFQLVCVVALLGYMQAVEMSYWQGVAGWGMLLATTMTTTFWLEARGAGAVLKWEWLRLVCGGCVALWAAFSGAGFGLIVVAAAYLLANVWFLTRLSYLRPAVAVSEPGTVA